MKYHVEIHLVYSRELYIDAADKAEAIEYARERVWETLNEEDFDVDAAAWPVLESIP